MTTPTMVIGLDAAEPRLIEEWMDAGHLPNLSNIRHDGIYGRLDNTVSYCGVATEYSTTEPLWATFSTGCRADRLGYWDTVSYNPHNYEIRCDNEHIRINLKGRERDGIVEPEEYHALCQELSEILYELQDARTGNKIVKQVVVTRTDPLDNNPKLPDADIVILWQEPITDVVDSAKLGRVGPLTHCRAGGHKSQGFFLGKGPNIPPGLNLPQGETVDLAPTILGLMNAQVPAYMDGQDLLRTATTPAYSS